MPNDSGSVTRRFPVSKLFDDLRCSPILLISAEDFNSGLARIHEDGIGADNNEKRLFGEHALNELLLLSFDTKWLFIVAILFWINIAPWIEVFFFG